MYRRLYFSFPDPARTGAAAAHLRAAGVDQEHMHAVARAGTDLSDLPSATEGQRSDALWCMECRLWNTNLGVFWLALAGLVAALLADSAAWTVLALAAMIVTFTAGYLFSTRLPHAHLGELREALAHGEVALLVDVPKGRVAEVDDLVHRHTPDAAAGGVGWTPELPHHR